MATRRTKRWDGNLSSLSVDYLNEVTEKIQAYGAGVQFEFPGHAKMPNYQIINKRGLKMGFNGKHLLLSLNENGNISDHLSAEFSLEQVQKSMLAPPPKTTRARTSSTSGVRKTASAVAAEQIEVQKYNYFRENRSQLPEGIQQHADAISVLMQKGLSAEDAFKMIVEQYYE